MNTAAASPSLTFYPAYCFSLSPTYHTWARLTAADVHALTTRPGFEGISRPRLPAHTLIPSLFPSQPTFHPLRPSDPNSLPSCPLSGTVINALHRTGQNLYFHLNHPIRWIRLVGAIVALDAYERRLVLTLDDSSGHTIELTCAKAPASTDDLRPHPDHHSHPHPETLATATTTTTTGTAVSASGKTLSLAGVDVGSIVKAKGGISEFRGTKQMSLERIAVVETTDAEAGAWEEGVRFRMEVLAGPWVVEEGVRRRLEVEAVGRGKRGKGRGRGGGKRKGGDGGEVGEEGCAGGEGRRSRRVRAGKGTEGEGEGEAVERLRSRGHRHRHKHRHKRRESDKENLKGEG